MKNTSFFKKLFESKFQDDNEIQITREPQSDTHSPIRLGIWIIIIGFGGFLLWAAFAPLDEGVPTQGAVSIDTKRKVVQHLSGGIVMNVYVREGQVVKAHELLLRLDNSMAKARYEEIRQRYIGGRALENRLQAEQQETNSIKFHSDILKMKRDPLAEQQMNNQRMLLASSRATLKAEIQGIEESIKGQEAQIVGLIEVIESRRSQQRLLNEQLIGIFDLVEDGYAPKSQQRDLQLRLAQINADLADSQSTLLKIKRGISEARQQILARQEEHKKDVASQMAQIRLEVDSNADKLKAMAEDLNLTEVRAPVAGQVVGLQFQTIGSVIQAGQKILDIVPANEGLLVEVKIAPHLIDRVHSGQFADIRFSSFANSPQLAIEGKVISLSEDLLTEPGSTSNQPGSAYYLARVSITDDGMKKLAGRTLQPGMPVQVIIKTGERSLLVYLLHPFIKRFSASLKEE